MFRPKRVPGGTQTRVLGMSPQYPSKGTILDPQNYLENHRTEATETRRIIVRNLIVLLPDFQIWIDIDIEILKSSVILRELCALRVKKMRNDSIS